MKKIIVITGGSDGLGKSLADEVAKYGIRVTNLMPGMMKTEKFSNLLEELKRM